MSGKFPEGWGSAQAKLVAGKNNKNQIDVKGVIYTYMTVPTSAQGNLINGEVVASGKGQLKLWASTCVRKPDDKRGFGARAPARARDFRLGGEAGAAAFQVRADPL